MNLKEYQKNATRTCVDLGSEKLNLSHMVMGMCTELSELQDAIENEDSVNIGEELADFQWYLGNYNTLRGYEYTESRALIPAYDINDLYYTVSELQDVIKKYVAYDKEINEKSEKPLLFTLQHLIDSLYLKYELNQEEYLEKNINKLKARYPDKFNTKDALDRDLETERKILES
jgi:NTP pyrophosphatase (non-canonical NTP hydrolase)